MGFALQPLRDAAAAIRTPRLRFALPQPDQADDVVDLLNISLPDLAFIDWTAALVDRPWAEQFLRRSAALNTREEAVIVHACRLDTGRLVALYDLHSFDAAVPRCQIGYVGHSAASGQGLVREGALALVDAAFAAGIRRIEAWCDARNQRSVRFAEGLGFRREGLLRQVSRDPRGELADEWLLARLSDDPPPA